MATVRSAAKGDDIVGLHPSWRPNLSFEYAPDIVTPGAFREVFKKNHNRFEYVIHTASPVNFAISDIQKELIDPAVAG